MADSLLNEVDDALRADRAAAFWHRHRTTIITIAAALILGTAANSWWQGHRAVQGGKLLEALHANQQLLANGKAKDAAAGFKTIAKDANGEIKGLAYLWQSRAHQAAKQPEEAKEALVLAAGSGAHLWKDIACLRLAGLDASAATPCLAATQKSPLAATRAEWSIANLWAHGKTGEAIRALERQLANPDTSPDAKARLTQWLASMKAGQSGVER